MMLGKIAGSAFVIAATSKIGFDTANKYEKRVKDLQAIESGLWLLKTEIDFSMTMLPYALKKCSTLLQQNISELFCNVAIGIEDGLGTYESWDKALKTADLSITKEDEGVLLDFAGAVGNSDADTEKSNIDKIIERLKISEQSAIEESKKYGKIFRTLGVSFGVIIAVILI